MLDSLDYTYAYSKYSCVREFYFIHVVFCYLVCISGLACLITRLVPRISFMHIYFGRAYVINMLICTATSMLIHNTGVLISFCFVIGGLVVGWIIIWLHQNTMMQKALQRIQERIGRGEKNLNLAAEIGVEKGKISQGKTFKERMFSYKTVHGCLMFTSWINLVGRIFASNQSGDFTCHTYPVYKNISNPEYTVPADGSWTFVEEINPTYSKLPWANKELQWGLQLSFGPMAGAFLFGCAFAFFSAKKASSGDSPSQVKLTAEADI